MPPKVKITKNDIISRTLDLVRERGVDAINARSIAGALGCSTQPIFSNFESLEQLEREVYKAAYELYLSYIENEVKNGKYPAYKSFGMAYVRFAREECELFKMLFMCQRDGEKLDSTPDVDKSIEMIMQANGICRKTAELIHLEMWAFVHGIATMLATSFLNLDEELISQMLTDVYQGVRDKLLKEKNKDACN